MTDRAVQPEAPTTEAGRRLLEDFFGDGMILEPLEAILAIEAEARAASQERPQPDDDPPYGPRELARIRAGVAQERPRPDTDGALRAALVRLIAAQDVNASVGERMAATTAARAALAGEEQWNNESPESGATATGSSATSAPFATRSGDEPTDCPRCHHESRWHRIGGCVATYRTVDGETPCRCRDPESAP
jgi:hypothetical protein